MAIIIDGKKTSEDIRLEIKEKVNRIKEFIKRNMEVLERRNVA